MGNKLVFKFELNDITKIKITNFRNKEYYEASNLLNFYQTIFKKPLAPQ